MWYLKVINLWNLKQCHVRNGPNIMKFYNLYSVLDYFHAKFHTPVTKPTAKTFHTAPLCFPTYLLTPWIRVFLEKLMGSQLGKIFSTFNGNRRFSTAFSSAHHLTISARSIQSMPHHPTSRRSILIISSPMSESSKLFFPSGFHTKTLYTSPFPSTC